jgi:hypothetical protein
VSIDERVTSSYRSNIRKVSVCDCHDELMTGDDRGDTATAHDAVVNVRREAAAALARLADAAVGYADARIAEETAAASTSGLPRIKRQSRVSLWPMSLR